MNKARYYCCTAAFGIGAFCTLLSAVTLHEAHTVISGVTALVAWSMARDAASAHEHDAIETRRKREQMEQTDREQRNAFRLVLDRDRLWRALIRFNII